jgi:hypothetical protein
MGEPRGPAVVRFEVDADELPAQQFLDMAGDFIALLREVDREMAPQARVRWVIDSISKSSPLLVALRPETSSPKATKAVRRSIVSAVNGGIRTVQARAVRPAHFTDRALEKAKALVESASVGGAVVKIGTAKAPVRVTSKLIANVDTILGATISSIGTIEGPLETLNVHGSNRYFNVYDALTGERIRCDFGNRIEIDQIGAAVERRVAVHGEIKYRENGGIVNVLAQSMEVFPAEDELPSANAVRGILAD